jgi:hypothetical protein
MMEVPGTLYCRLGSGKLVPGSGHSLAPVDEEEDEQLQQHSYLFVDVCEECFSS